MPSKPCIVCERWVPIFLDGACPRCHVELVDSGQRPSGSIMPRACPVEGCADYVVKKGLCDRHYRRVADHGTVAKVRREGPADHRLHPYYKNWLWLRKQNKLCAEWLDFESFMAGIGDRPSERHRLWRHDPKAPYSRDNFYWKKPIFDHAHSGLNTKDGRATYDREYQRFTRAHTPSYWSKAQRKRYYGMAEDDFDSLMEKQGGVCAICKKPETKRSKTGRVLQLSIDHDHATNAIRGLLCGAHNALLGYAEDDAALLTESIIYLAKHSTDPAAVLSAAITKLQANLPAVGTA